MCEVFYILSNIDSQLSLVNSKIVYEKAYTDKT